MTYELTCDKYLLGYFPSEAEARHHAQYLPKGKYVIHELAQDGDSLIFESATNLAAAVAGTKSEDTIRVFKQIDGNARGAVEEVPLDLFDSMCRIVTLASDRFHIQKLAYHACSHFSLSLLLCHKAVSTMDYADTSTAGRPYAV